MPRNSEFNYEYQNSGGKTQPEGSEKISKVVVYLKGSKAQSAKKLATEFAEVSKQKAIIKKTEEDLKKKIQPFMEEFFEIEDSTWTRVVETAGVILTMSKASTTSKFNHEKFLERIGKEFPKLKEKFDAIAAEYVSISDRASTIKGDVKNEGFGDAVKAFQAKIGAQVKKFVASIKSFLTSYDAKLDGWKRELISNVQIESHDKLVSGSQRYLRD